MFLLIKLKSFRRYTYTWISIIIISLLQFKFNLLRIDDKTLYNDLFGEDALDPKCNNYIKKLVIILNLNIFFRFHTST